MTVLVTGDRGPRTTLAAVLAALDAGPPCAVVDPTWPPTWQEQIKADLARLPPEADLVVFSSGSTTRPRGIVRRADSWSASHGPLADLVGIGSDDVVWVPGRLASTLSLYGAVHATAVGAATVLAGEDPRDATVVHVSPAGLDAVLDRRAAGAVPSLRLAIVAGDLLGADRRARAVDAGLHVVEYYGAAELSFVAIDLDGTGLRPFPGVTIDLREPADDLATIWVRSPYLAEGYLAGAGPMRRDGEWATVEDLGHWHGESGRSTLEIAGRGDLAVTTAGHTVLVEEVESVLRRIPGVDDVAVTGLRHPSLGAILAAVIVGPADEVDLRRAVRSLPAPSRPRLWIHAEGIPRTAGGKVRRDAVRALAEDAR